MPAWIAPQRLGLARAVAALFLVALVLSANSLWRRHILEESSDTITLVVDGREAALQASVEGLEPEAFLRLLKAHGVTAIGLHEHTIQDAVDEGRAFVVSDAALSTLAPGIAPKEIPASSDTIILGWAGGEPWLDRALKTATERIGRPLLQRDDLTLWRVPVDVPLSAISLGFDPGEVERIRSAGLDVAPRLRPTEGRPLQQIEEILAQMAGMPVAAVVFWGTEVTGYPAYLESVGASLSALGAPIGIVEFADQRGLDALAKAVDYRLARVHSITEREMEAGLDRDEAVRRWERAVRERGVRVAYVRLYPDMSAEENAAYVGAIANRLRELGFALGRTSVEGFGERRLSPLPALLGGALLTGVALGWLADRLFTEARRPFLWAVAGGLGCLVVFGVLWLKGYTVAARQIAALLAAASFPAAAVLVGVQSLSGGSDKPTSDFGAPLRQALSAMALTTLVTASGALLVALFLDDVRFLVKLESFRGVKAAYAIPLGIVLAHQVRLSERDRGWKIRLDSSVRLWHVLLAGGVLGLCAVYLLRSGNQGLPVSGIETFLRTLLEETFGARPRTKEFLVGYPLLLTSFALMASRNSIAALLAHALVMLGTVGPVSMINTFAHAHSPIALSLLRSGYGLILGAFIGVAAACLGLYAARVLANAATLGGAGGAGGKSARAAGRVSGSASK